MLQNGTITLENCINYHRHTFTRDINISYSAHQMFNMFPLRSSPQVISNMGTRDVMSEKYSCLTAKVNNDVANLIMSQCNPKFSETTQSFVLTYREAKRMPDTITSISNNLPAVGFVSIKWSPKDSNENEFCVAIKSYGNSKVLSLQNCKHLSSPSRNKKANNNFSSIKAEFLYERTFSSGPTVSPLFYFPGKLGVKSKKTILLNRA